MNCQYCKEEVHEEAIKCKHCGSSLENQGEGEKTLSAFGYFTNGFKNYVTFAGRARRREYWFFLLFYFIFLIGLSFIDGALGLYSFEAGMGALSGIFALAALLPSLAVTVRRLHDTNRSGWWVLLSIVPLVGPIVLLVFLCQGSRADNQYGKSPKAIAV